MPLQLDYRPQNLEEFFGNETVKSGITAILSRKEAIPHTFLLSGPSGCGKTTLARIIASMLGCSELDRREYNISDMRGIDTAREIIQSCRYEPLYGEVRVIILNEAHKATNDFQNAMLEILEEPPSKVFFIICTTEPDKLIKTIRTRATTYHVSPLIKHEMLALIDWVLRSENRAITPKVIDGIVFASDGSPRVALKILDQIIDITGEVPQLESISKIAVDETLILDLCQAILAKKPGNKRWEELSILLKGFDSEAESARRSILGYLSKALLNQKGDEAKRTALIMAEFINNYYDSLKPGLVISCYMSTLI